MKPLIKFFSIFMILLLTASAASAACSYHYGEYYYKHYTNSEWNCQYSDWNCQYSDWNGEYPDWSSKYPGWDGKCPDWNSEYPNWNPPVPPIDEPVPPAPPIDEPVPSIPPIDEPVPPIDEPVPPIDEPVPPIDEPAPPVDPIDDTGTTTVRLCSNNVCTVGGNGQVLTLTNYNNAVDPTYDQLLEFLRVDKTDEQPYTSTYVCSDFAKTLHDNAEAVGIRAGWVGAIGANHAFNVFDTTDQGTVYIDCTGVPGGATLQDKQLNVEIGQPLSGKYLFRQGTISGMGGTVTSLLVYW